MNPLFMVGCCKRGLGSVVVSYILHAVPSESAKGNSSGIKAFLKAFLHIHVYIGFKFSKII